MKYIPKLFIETTVYNFYFEGRAKSKQKAAKALFEAIAKGKYKAYMAEAVVKELKAASNEKSQKMLDLIKKHKIEAVPEPDAAKDLAALYIKKSIIPAKQKTDALHIAVATVNNLDFVVSYNMGHIVKPKTMIATGFTNLEEGYKQIGLCTPTEVVEYDS